MVRGDFWHADELPEGAELTGTLATALWRLMINPSLPQSVHDSLHGTTTAMTWPAVVNRFRRWHFPEIYFAPPSTSLSRISLWPNDPSYTLFERL